MGGIESGISGHPCCVEAKVGQVSIYAASGQ